jgi:hypothetical protein
MPDSCLWSSKPFDKDQTLRSFTFFVNAQLR